MTTPIVTPKLFNPSSFAQQLTPEHKVWVQSVHKTLLFILNQLGVVPTGAEGYANAGSIPADIRSTDGQKRP